MAKRVQKNQIEEDKCPGCGKRCLYMKAWDNGDFIAAHKIERRKTRSSATGLLIECDVLMDACTKMGKIGLDHPVEVDF